MPLLISTAWAVMDMLKCVIRRHWCCFSQLHDTTIESCGPRFCPNCGGPSVSVGRSRLLRAIYYHTWAIMMKLGMWFRWRVKLLYPIVECAGHKMLSRDPLSSERAKYLPKWVWNQQARILACEWSSSNADGNELADLLGQVVSLEYCLVTVHLDRCRSSSTTTSTP
jgi:hypothetical protein